MITNETFLLTTEFKYEYEMLLDYMHAVHIEEIMVMYVFVWIPSANKQFHFNEKKQK